jgi:hypothetical protein
MSHKQTVQRAYKHSVSAVLAAVLLNMLISTAVHYSYASRSQCGACTNSNSSTLVS